MNKKIASEIAVGFILLIAVVVGSIFWLQSKKEIAATENQREMNIAKQEAQKPIEENGVFCAQDAKLCDDGSYVSRTGPKCEFAACPNSQIVEGEYKLVEIKNPVVSFSFEIPKKWSAETRLAGEDKLSDDDFKEFLSTGMDKFGSAYADMTQEMIDKLNSTQIATRINEFPIMSVADDSINYKDTNWKQIDFYIKPALSFEEEESNLRKNCSEAWACEEVKTNKEGFYETVREGIMPNCKLIEDTVLGGQEALHVEFNMDIYDGKPTSSKSCSGGHKYFVRINRDLLLEINKQARADEQFEKDFEHLIQTLKIKAL